MSKADIACYSETTEKTVVVVLSTFLNEQGLLTTKARKVIIKTSRCLKLSLWAFSKYSNVNGNIALIIVIFIATSLKKKQPVYQPFRFL
ncbi:MAG: hypothetical protein ABIW38_07880 [Ferruginibacter sp.]